MTQFLREKGKKKTENSHMVAHESHVILHVIFISHELELV